MAIPSKIGGSGSDLEEEGSSVTTASPVVSPVMILAPLRCIGVKLQEEKECHRPDNKD